MNDQQEKIMELEQALYAVLSASKLLMLDTEDVRLRAIGGLLMKDSWPWVDKARAKGAVEQIQQAARHIRLWEQRH
ncbi:MULTISPECIES: hypothetical protein [Pseudomonas]|jgi:hypothetical protein|uniref:hypothetical protein n=1 Tax=Pseudomonas TaxID=286 RepID=UPI000863787D|nr:MULTISPECIES: hypothetical protein [Pseudomonas]MBH3376479.1 hypothetical protein [Pseudomonas juntendi]MBS6040876.1 hypothetical protein [Pseudomonas sp.]MDD1989914.1 hypothetical protein [Pseudomonas putida]MDG9892043.1 hypothetical protein [Pseudomonas juntendi]QOH70614.1 hypothetical protein IGB31_24235 [Pseudomonas putida]